MDKWIVEVAADLIGWLFLLTIVGGAYVIGYAAADAAGLDAHRHAAGIISIVATIWGYEHQRAQQRWEKLLDMPPR